MSDALQEQSFLYKRNLARVREFFDDSKHIDVTHCYI